MIRYEAVIDYGGELHTVRLGKYTYPEPSLLPEKYTLVSAFRSCSMFAQIGRSLNYKLKVVSVYAKPDP